MLLALLLTTNRLTPEIITNIKTVLIVNLLLTGLPYSPTSPGKKRSFHMPLSSRIPGSTGNATQARFCAPDPAARPIREALLEADESAKFYEERQEGLGKRFVEALSDAINRNGVIYRNRNKSIEIIAVMHLKRKPDYWKNRV